MTAVQNHIIIILMCLRIYITVLVMCKALCTAGLVVFLNVIEVDGIPLYCISN